MAFCRHALLIPFLATCLCFAELNAQSIPPYVAENGIPDILATALLQDQTGYLWIGTPNGLIRYDGYTQTDQPLTGAPRAHILSLLEDQHGMIWVGTQADGIHVFSGSTDALSKQMWNGPAQPVHHLHEDNQGAIWAGTDNGLFVSKQGTLFKRPGLEEESLVSQEITGIISVPGQDTLIVSTNQGLYLLNTITNTVQRWLDVPVQTLLLQNDRVWITNSEGVFFGHFTEKSLALLDGSEVLGGLVQNLYIDAGGLLLMGTREGLFYSDPLAEGGIKPLPDLRRIALSQALTHVFEEDHSGLVWMGTSNMGLLKARRNQQHFSLFHYDPSLPNGSDERRVISITEDGHGNLWVGTRNGLFRYDASSHALLEVYQSDPSDAQSLRSNMIRDLLYDRQGRLWIGCYEGGLSQYDYENNRFIHFTDDLDNPFSISDLNIIELTEARDGTIWIGTEHGGLNRFDPATNRFESWNYEISAPSGIASSHVHELLEDSRGNLWLGLVRGGLQRFNRETNSFSPLNLPENESVFSLLEDKSGTIWIGTATRGLGRFDPRTGTLSFILLQDDRVHDLIYGILEDDQGALWLSTNRGFLKFYPEDESFEKFGPASGILPGAHGAWGLYKSPTTGTLYFGGYNGLIAFQPDRIVRADTPPLLVLDSLDVDGVPVVRASNHSKTKTQRIALPHGYGQASLYFTALHFDDANQNKYRFRLDPIDPTWRSSSTSRHITILPLPAQKYTLHVQAASAGGTWMNTTYELELEALSPWWHSVWFYLLTAITLVSLTYAYNQFRLSRLQQQALELEDLVKKRTAKIEEQAERLKEMDKTKSRFFANISHEFRTPLTLILGPLSQFKDSVVEPAQKRSVQTMQRNARRLLRLINQLLDLSRLEAGVFQLDARPANIVPFVQDIVNAFEDLSRANDIALAFRCEEEQVIVRFDSEKMEQILFNLLSNAFKFTPASGTIEVTLKNVDGPFADGTVLIAVRDTGIGIPEEKVALIFDRFYQVADGLKKQHPGSGIGLALCKELVQLHKGQIRATSTPGVGTTIEILLPTTTASPAVNVSNPGVSSSVLVQLSDEQQAIVPEVAQANTSPAPPLLLVVEDNSDVRSYIRDVLGSHYTIIEAPEGKTGLELAFETIPDLIISDVMMPEIDGFELCRTLKTDERTSHIPLILLTAKNEAESKLEGLETGADNYLTKPFDVRELHTRIRNLLAIRKALKAKYSKDVISIGPSIIDISKPDRKFMTRVMEVVSSHYQDPEFDVEQFSSTIGMSSSQLYRKIKGLTDQSPVEFLRSFRLEAAAQLLKKGGHAVSEACYAVGFNTPSYFAKCFREAYGVKPSEYAMSPDTSPATDRP